MEKKYFVLKLLPPRPTYAFDMTETERAVMKEHAIYWKELTCKGISILFGPVMDSRAPYGLGIVEVELETDANNLASNDPVIKAGIGCSYEVFPMQVGMIRKQQAYAYSSQL
jgi:uncharacterized protein